MSVLPLSLAEARAAGEALGKIRSKASVQAIDAIVVSFASAHGGVVYTGDVADLERIRAANFPSVRVLGVGDAT